MKAILKFIKKTYKDVLQSIAFYPVLISLCLFTLALIGLNIENLEIVKNIKKNIPYLFIQDYETARSILSTLIGGILSLTVFSFTMVMVVLNQASSDFSPRLLPGLISNKRHQIILGIYIGTLLYCIIMLISLGAYGVESNSLGLSTMFGAVLGVLCVGLFVYFIHSISKAIQIHNIIDRIFKRCSEFLDRQLKWQREETTALKKINSEEWTVIESETTGYFREFDISLMNHYLKNTNNQIEVLPYPNQHIWKGDPVLKLKVPIPEEELPPLHFCLDISSDRHEEDGGIGGMIKLMEIAVKAMSPGINDPGTAVDVIIKLGQLLNKMLQFPPLSSNKLEGGEVVVIKNSISAKQLMVSIVQPIRLYSKNDAMVLSILIQALTFAKGGINVSDENKQVVLEELEALKYDLEKNVGNPLDKAYVLKLF
ncbi:DUF2254 domain-containing protein [Flavobacteriaceae bacterium F89]|uniref:DUF2254 domain-containing protein n=1 Tax=Cerina litoralis TaxID=2874477 RepID=A0AAE3EXT4_9FLAO|nr:DUF2254 domain-containing protein [Cerina litoralis]MCG2462475.1 DUF2254 domain-containing protein [Cerina litoralis]